VVAVGLVVWLLALGEPARQTSAAPPGITVVPSWTGPATVDLPGVLADGAGYTPRLYVNAQTSVGVALGGDGSVRVIVANASGTFSELRRHDAGRQVQVNGFATDGDTLVWMETSAESGRVVNALWRATWSVTGPPIQITTNTGEVRFHGVQADLLVADGQVSWAAIVPEQVARTEVRSVPLSGGQVTVREVDGDLLLSTRPWAVSLPGGPGSPATLLNLATDERVDVESEPDEAVFCDPTWCRVSVTGEAALVAIDVMHPDGSDRRRIAGPEATPTIGDATLLDRFVPLTTDLADGVGLSLHDLQTGRTDLVAREAANVQGRGGILWWSTGVGATLVWHALDLTALGQSR
jgi:hypothetical protein